MDCKRHTDNVSMFIEQVANYYWTNLKLHALPRQQLAKCKEICFNTFSRPIRIETFSQFIDSVNAALAQVAIFDWGIPNHVLTIVECVAVCSRVII